MSDNIYSFALDPLKHQPNGVCDFSKIYDTIHLYTYDTDPITGLMKLVPLNNKVNINFDSLALEFEKLNLNK